MPEDADPADDEEREEEVEDEDDDEDEDGEETPAFKEAHKQWQAEMKQLFEQTKAAKRAQVSFGGTKGSESTVQAIHDAFQIVTVAEDQVPFIERFMNGFGRIAIEMAQKAARAKKWPDVYQRLVAILLAVTRFDHWLEDTEDPDENNKILKKLGTQWEKLLATHESGEWPALERDVDACKKSLQIVNDKLHTYDNCDYAAYKLPVKGVVRQKRTRG